VNQKTKLVAMAQEIEKNLRELRRVLRKPVEAEFARGELTGTQRALMQILFHSNGLSLKELSGRMGLAHATVSGIVDRLEERGMVERHRDPADARISQVMVSNAVHHFMQKTLPAIEFDPLVEGLRRATLEERKTVLEGLRILRRVTGDAEILSKRRTKDRPQILRRFIEKS
jgi:DNA-binding MarR family transcriptional regulator